MSNNLYAPPKAEVQDILHHGGDQPALWNPNAAANWSLLFSPAFGALVHMKNWQSLGDAKKAQSAKMWAIASLVFLVAFAFIENVAPDSLASAPRSLGLVWLVTWYVASGRAQSRYVKERFGTTYPRKGWAKPLSLAVGAVVGLFVVLFIAGFVLGALGYGS